MQIGKKYRHCSTDGNDIISTVTMTTNILPTFLQPKVCNYVYLKTDRIEYNG